MDVASLIVAIAAVVISSGSAVFAWRSAVAAQRSASASEGYLAIERERRLEERRPHVAVALEGTGKSRVLKITLESDEPLANLGVEIVEWHFYGPAKEYGGWECEFNPRVYGVVVPSPGDPALNAYCYNPYDGTVAGLRPHQTVSWAINTRQRLEWLRLDVTCHGNQGERWDMRLQVEAQPEIEDTVH